MEVQRSNKVPVEHETRNLPTENEESLDTADEEFISFQSQNCDDDQNGLKSGQYYSAPNHGNNCPCQSCCYEVNTATFGCNLQRTEFEKAFDFNQSSILQQSFHFGRQQYEDDIFCRRDFTFPNTASTLARTTGHKMEKGSFGNVAPPITDCSLTRTHHCWNASEDFSRHAPRHNPPFGRQPQMSRRTWRSGENADDEDSTDDDIQSDHDGIQSRSTKPKGVSKIKMRSRVLQISRSSTRNTRRRKIAKPQIGFGVEIPVTIQHLEEEDKAVEDYKSQIFNRKGIPASNCNIKAAPITSNIDTLPSVVTDYNEQEAEKSEDIFNSSDSNNGANILSQEDVCTDQIHSAKITNISIDEDVLSFCNSSKSDHKMSSQENSLQNMDMLLDTSSTKQQVDELALSANESTDSGFNESCSSERISSTSSSESIQNAKEETEKRTEAKREEGNENGQNRSQNPANLQGVMDNNKQPDKILSFPDKRVMESKTKETSTKDMQVPSSSKYQPRTVKEKENIIIAPSKKTVETKATNLDDLAILRNNNEVVCPKESTEIIRSQLSESVKMDLKRENTENDSLIGSGTFKLSSPTISTESGDKTRQAIAGEIQSIKPTATSKEKSTADTNIPAELPITKTKQGYIHDAKLNKKDDSVKENCGASTSYHDVLDQSISIAVSQHKGKTHEEETNSTQHQEVCRLPTDETTRFKMKGSITVTTKLGKDGKRKTAMYTLEHRSGKLRVTYTNMKGSSKVFKAQTVEQDEPSRDICTFRQKIRTSKNEAIKSEHQRQRKKERKGKHMYLNEITYFPWHLFHDITPDAKIFSKTTGLMIQPTITYTVTQPMFGAMTSTNLETPGALAILPKMALGQLTSDADKHPQSENTVSFFQMTCGFPLWPKEIPQVRPCDVRYPMNRRPIGIAAIFLNENLIGHPSRRGARKDLDNFLNLWWSVGFKIDVHIDKTRDEIRNIIRDYGRRNHTFHDAFVVCISAHGYRGHFLGTGNGAVNILKDIVQPLHECATLKGKPKLCFVQACQSIETRSESGFPICQERDHNPDRSERVTANIDLPMVQQVSEVEVYDDSSGCREKRSESGFPICQEHDHDPSKSKRVTDANTELPIVQHASAVDDYDDSSGSKYNSLKGNPISQVEDLNAPDFPYSVAATDNTTRHHDIQRLEADANHSDSDAGNVHTIDLEPYPDFLISFASFDGLSLRDTVYGSIYPISLQRNVKFYSPSSDIQDILEIAVGPEVEMMTSLVFYQQSPKSISSLRKKLCFPLADVAMWQR